MPPRVVTVGFCPQYRAAFRVPGTRPGVTYTVDTDDVLGWRCTCPAFSYSRDRSCKHIKRVWKHACLHNQQWHDAGPNDLADHGITLLSPAHHGGLDPCPGCGEQMIPIRIAV
jgi:hypothetical protein